MNGSPSTLRERSRSPLRVRSRSREMPKRYGGIGGRREDRSRSRSRGGRSHSRSPMPSTSRHTANRASPRPLPSRSRNVRGSSRHRPLYSRSRSYSPRKMNGSPPTHRERSRSALRVRSKSREMPKRYGGIGGQREYRSRSRSRRGRSHSRSPMSSRSRHTTNSVSPPPSSGLSRGFAFIYYESMEDAKAAKYSCNGIEIDNRRIRVDFSITQRAHTPTPGIYMDKPTMDGKPRPRRDDYSGYRRSPSPYYSERRSHFCLRYSRSRSCSPRAGRRRSDLAAQTRQVSNIVNVEDGDEIDLGPYCLCKKGWDGAEEMLLCDACKQWFHITCLGIPENQFLRLTRTKHWICPECHT